MFKFLKTIFAGACVIASLLLLRYEIAANWPDIMRQYFPCQTPQTYSIGTFDDRFGISRSEFEKDIAAAAAVWEKVLGKKILAYAPDGSGDLKINLIYDYRQDSTDTLAKLGLQITESQAGYNQIKNRYIVLKTTYDKDKAALDARIQTFQSNTAALNTDIRYWNSRGGASGTEYQNLTAREEGLRAESKNIQAAEQSLANEAQNINALVVVLNQLASTLNLDVNKYNEVGAQTGAEFDEGLYIQDSAGRRIEIYQFNNENKLVRVMTHELGHALGLNHVDDPKAIMYKLNQSENLTPTAADVAELKTACHVK